VLYETVIPVTPRSEVPSIPEALTQPGITMRILWSAVCFASLLLLGYFVWPTPYAPIVIGRSELGELGVIGARRNRLTGEVQWLYYPEGWVSHRPDTTSDPGEALRKLAEKTRR
jgi:hypothetical protein